MNKSTLARNLSFASSVGKLLPGPVPLKYTRRLTVEEIPSVEHVILSMTVCRAENQGHVVYGNASSHLGGSHKHNSSYRSGKFPHDVKRDTYLKWMYVEVFSWPTSEKVPNIKSRITKLLKHFTKLYENP